MCKQTTREYLIVAVIFSFYPKHFPVFLLFTKNKMLLASVFRKCKVSVELRLLQTLAISGGTEELPVQITFTNEFVSLNLWSTILITTIGSFTVTIWTQRTSSQTRSDLWVLSLLDFLKDFLNLNSFVATDKIPFYIKTCTVPKIAPKRIQLLSATYCSYNFRQVIIKLTAAEETFKEYWQVCAHICKEAILVLSHKADAETAEWLWSGKR